MNEKLKRHINRHITGWIAQAKLPPGLGRTAYLMICAKEMFARSNDPDERRGWRKVIDGLNETADKQKAAILKQREGIG